MHVTVIVDCYMHSLHVGTGWSIRITIRYGQFVTFLNVRIYYWTRVAIVHDTLLPNCMLSMGPF